MSEVAAKGAPIKESLCLDVIVVGAGFAGLYSLFRLREAGFSAKVFEAGDAPGGTWYWNRYPGARCDVQSLVYCYLFDEKLHRAWNWSERYATQPEIVRYIDFVVDQLGLLKDICFNSPVERAAFDERASQWSIATKDGVTATANHVIMATGALSATRLPGIKGLDQFRGECYHTGRWPKEGVVFANKRVGIIGTGSSGVQAIPLIAQKAKHLTVFQRTPPYVVPARNAPIPAEDLSRFYSRFDFYRESARQGEIGGTGDLLYMDHLPSHKPHAADMPHQERQRLMEECWKVGGLSIGRIFGDAFTDMTTNTLIGDFIRSKIREIVKDTSTAMLLTPITYPFGSKRVCVGTNYYETFNRENVLLVDVEAASIKELTSSGLQTTEHSYELDMIIFATGFDSLTGALSRIDLRGKGGRLLRDYWAEEGPQAYLGLSVAGFPNMYTVNGPGSPGIIGNVVLGIEQHVDWIVELLKHVRQHAIARVEADPEEQKKWYAHVNEVAQDTIYAKGKNWWLKDGAKGKARVFVPYIRGLKVYREICNEVAANGYRGLNFTRFKPETRIQ